MIHLHSKIESVHYNKNAEKISDPQEYYQQMKTALSGGTLRKSHLFWNQLVQIEIKKKKQGQILDYGCGTGIHTVELGNENWQVKGIDISHKSVEIANALCINFNTQKWSQYTVMDCQKMDFTDNYFDIILDYGSFSSLNMSLALPELIRVLKPDGVIISIETYGHNPVTNFKRYLNVIIGSRTRWAAAHIMKLKDWTWIKGHFSKSEFYYFAVILPITDPIIRIAPPGLKNFLINCFEKIDSIFVFLIKKWAFKTVVVLRKSDQ